MAPMAKRLAARCSGVDKGDKATVLNIPPVCGGNRRPGSDSLVGAATR